MVDAGGWLGSVDVTRLGWAVARYWVPGHHWQPPSAWSPALDQSHPARHQATQPSLSSTANIFYTQTKYFLFYPPCRRTSQHGHNSPPARPRRVSRCRGNLCLTTLCWSLLSLLPAACQLQYLPIRYALIQGPHNTHQYQSYLQLTAVAVLLATLKSINFNSIPFIRGPIFLLIPQ